MNTSRHLDKEISSLTTRKVMVENTISELCIKRHSLAEYEKISDEWFTLRCDRLDTERKILKAKIQALIRLRETLTT